MERKYKSNCFSQAGTYHGSDEKNNQDAMVSDSNERFAVIVLADGVSSCKKGGEGAKITVETVKELFLKHAERLFLMEDVSIKQVISSKIKDELKTQAEKDGIDYEEYASTLCAILVDKKQNKAMFTSIGDSLILGVKNQEVYIVTPPADSRNGIPTTVMTDLSYYKVGKLQPEKGELAVDSFIACSDGAWKELYRRGRLRPEVKEMIVKRDYKGVTEFLKDRHTADDCTFITLDSERVPEKGVHVEEIEDEER